MNMRPQPSEARLQGQLTDPVKGPLIDREFGRVDGDRDIKFTPISVALSALRDGRVVRPEHATVTPNPNSSAVLSVQPVTGRSQGL